MKVSSMYQSHIVGFSGDASLAVSSKYSMYMFDITVDNGCPIAKPSYWFMSESSLKHYSNKMSTFTSGYILGPLYAL